MNVTDQQINNLLDELLHLHPKRIDLSLDRFKLLLSKLDNPQDKIKAPLVISGTNGKYSVLRFLQEILRFNNKKLNTYVSPHLIRFNERFEFGDKIISNEDLEKILIKIKKINGSDSITFFEATSACFYDLCPSRECDFTIIETGLGGLMDCSAVAKSILSIITPISFDHMDFLGSSIESISFNKSGSIKPNTLCVVGKQEYKDAFEILRDQAEHKQAPLFVYGKDWMIHETQNNIIYEDNENNLKFDLFRNHPSYQVGNLGIALAAASKIPGIKIDAFLDENKHNQTEIIGRFQMLKNKSINKIVSPETEIIYDGGHNESAAKILNQSINKLSEKPLCLILAMINTKSPQSFVSQFDQIELIRTVTIPNEKSAIPAAQLKKEVEGFCGDTETASSVREAVSEISNKFPNARILILGSFYMASEVLEN